MSSSASGVDVRAGVRRQRAADGDVQRRRPGNAGAGRRFAARRQADAAGAEAMGQLGQQRQRFVVAQLIERQVHLLVGVFRHQLDALVGPRLDPGARPEADRRVERLRAGVKEIERPDVDGAAGQIDSCRSRRRDTHDAIIILEAAMPLATRRDIGQFLIGSMPGTSIPVELRSLAREFDLGGVILFSRNIEAPEQVAELVGRERGARAGPCRRGSASTRRAGASRG